MNKLAPVRKLFFLLFALLCSTAATTSNTLDATDKQLMERTTELFQLFRNQSDAMWSKDYRLDQTLILLVRVEHGKDRYAYLINHPKATRIAGAKKLNLTDPSMNNVYRLNKPPQAREIAGISNFAFQVAFQGANTFIMKFTRVDTEEDPYTSPRSHDWTLYFAHEGFHNYQLSGSTWVDIHTEQDIPNYPLGSGHIALILLEDRILKTLAQQLRENSNDIDASAKELIAVREQRLQQWPQVAELDLPQEHAEGIALYIERQLGSRLGSKNINHNNLGQHLGHIPEEYARDELAFGRFYTSGAILAVLLDNKISAWKQKVAQGNSPYALVKQCYRSDNQSLKNASSCAKQKYNFTELKQTAKKVAAIAAKEPKDIFQDEGASAVWMKE